MLAQLLWWVVQVILGILLHAPGDARLLSVEGRDCKIWSVASGDEETATWSGLCVDGLAEGIGVAEWSIAGRPIGRVEGHMRAGLPDGLATWIEPSGERYDGEWREGQPHGRGVYTYRDGGRYDGRWRNGMPNGHGVRTWANGDRYDGLWRDSERDGKGTLYFASGWYWGEWRHDRPEGQGTAVINGWVHAGIWHGGCYRGGGYDVRVVSSKVECERRRTQ